jgi:hypothetical protein
MPGTADPALGSEVLTRALSVVASALVLTVPFVLGDRWPPAQFALGSGGVYAGVCLCCWLGARLLTDTLPSGLAEQPGAAVLLVLGSVVVLGAQVAVPVYGYVRYGAVVPLLATAVAANLVVYTVLLVRGETDPLGLYTLFFGPVLVVALAVLVGIEVGVRRLLLG